MKKIDFLIYTALILGVSSLSYSAALSLTISYPPIMVPHGAEISFNLERGLSNTMKSGTTYNLTCRTSANDKTAISLVQAPAGGFARWNSVTLDGNPVGNQFMVPINSTFEMHGINFNLMGLFYITNLDNENDLTLNCSAVPVF